jgi:polyisoprenoid-binding protein YceI
MLRMIFAAVLMIWPLQASADAFSDAAGRYRVQPSSVIHFSVAQMGGAAIEGEFKRFKGTFQLDGKNVARSKVDISIDTGSVSAADPRIEEFIKSEAVFDAANHPTVRFVSTGVARSGEKSAAIQGQLSAKGITRPTRFSVTLQEQNARTLKFHVTGKLSRALFKMDVGTPIYSNMVVLDMTLVGRKD